ncbi:Gfo/Idh/MocA family oxidoreductase [bacterium]|nr:Gfo/Idh/MocA family oxidoreductase [bacterium]
MSIKVGIIGAGGIVQLQHLPILSKLEDTEVTAICDIDSNKVRVLCEKYNIPKCCLHADEVFADPEIDAVLICTPTNSHMSLTLAALSAGKHVLVEKPIARTSSEAERMVKAAEKAGRFLMTAMNHRFRPDSLILQNFISKGELGKIFYVRSGWMEKREIFSRPSWVFDSRFSGGGVLMDLGIQMIDLCLWLTGCPKIRSVHGFTFKDVLKKKVEDAASAYIRIADGKLITLSVGWSIPTQKSIAYTIFHGERGTAWLNPLIIHRDLHGHMMELTPGKQYTPLELYHRSFENEIKHFIESVRHNHPPHSSGSEALYVLKVVEMLYQSAKEKREIVLEEPRAAD